MITKTVFVPCLFAAMLTGAMGSAQVHAGGSIVPEMTAASSSSKAPVAFVYVTGTVNNQYKFEIHGFAAAADGRLTAIPGSPFQDDVIDMAVNGKYLFGGNTDGIHINTLSIAGNGALHKVQSTLDDRHSGGNCDATGPLFLDHTGATLYNLESGNTYCADNTYQSFEVVKASGKLDFLGQNGDSAYLNVPLSFIGNNKYAYGASCQVLNNPGPGDSQIYGFERRANGLLTEVSIHAPLPAPKAGDSSYCPILTAADPTNHLAVSLVGMAKAEGSPDSSFQLATYTADENGNLSTTSTRNNMPISAVGQIFDMKMSPSGKLLAVGGAGGLQIFHFNGSQPITPYSKLLQGGNEINQMFWDNANHLYVVSSNLESLMVYTVTPTSLVEAPGSPYSIPVATNIIVQPKTARPAVQ